MELDLSLIQSYWHLLCHRSELPREGDYIRFDTMIGDVVIFNDGKEVVAFDNLCPHRGAIIYSGDHGNQLAICKYHGWTHRSGKLFVAHKGRFSDCNIDEASLNRYQTAWCSDFLFFAISPIQSLSAQLSGVEGNLETISSNIARRIDFNYYKYQCYWPLAIENALEPYHIDLIHPQTLATLKLEDGINTFSDKNSVWRARIGSERLSRQLASLKRFFDIEQAFDGYESIYLFPFTMISSTYGYSYSLQNFFPFSKLETAFNSRLYISKLASSQADKIMDSFFKSTAEVNRKVFDEDHAICSRIPASSWSMEQLRFHSNNEIKINHFRESCRDHKKNFI